MIPVGKLRLRALCEWRSQGAAPCQAALASNRSLGRRLLPAFISCRWASHAGFWSLFCFLLLENGSSLKLPISMKSLESGAWPDSSPPPVEGSLWLGEPHYTPREALS